MPVAVPRKRKFLVKKTIIYGIAMQRGDAAKKSQKAEADVKRQK
jgi:hypothetical protein